MKDLTEYTKAELVELGLELGLELNIRHSKDDLISEIQNLEIKDDEPKKADVSTKVNLRKFDKFN